MSAARRLATVAAALAAALVLTGCINEGVVYEKGVVCSGQPVSCFPTLYVENEAGERGMVRVDRDEYRSTEIGDYYGGSR